MELTTESAKRPPLALTLNRFLFIAGLTQIAAAFAPAAHVRLLRDISFIRLPTAGLAFVALGALASITAFRPRGWWRWIPGVASVGLLIVVYMKLRYAPSGGFFDPMLRRAVRPAWGFVPMAISALLMLIAAAIVRLEPRTPLDDRTDEP